MPFNGDVTNEVSNGLLLRADLHTLFDLDLLRIDPDTRKVVLADALLDTEYKTLNGHSLTEPVSPDDRPSRTSLKKRWESKKRIKLDG